MRKISDFLCNPYLFLNPHKKIPVVRVLDLVASTPWPISSCQTIRKSDVKVSSFFMTEVDGTILLKEQFTFFLFSATNLLKDKQL